MVAVLSTGKVLADCKYFRHLVEAQVELVHLSVSLFEAFEQVVNLEVNLFVLLIRSCVFFKSLDRLNI